jgi:hypothetical protein
MRLPGLGSITAEKPTREAAGAAISRMGARVISAYPLWIAVAVTLLTGFLVGFALYVLRTQAIRNAESLTSSFAKIVQEQTTRSLQGAEQRLYIVESELKRLRESRLLTETSGREVLRTHVLTSPVLSSVFVLNREGRVMFESAEGISGRLATQNKSFLKYLSESHSGFKISLPIQGRTSGNWLIAGSIPWLAEDGTHAGRIVALINARYSTIPTRWLFNDSKPAQR